MIEQAQVETPEARRGQYVNLEITLDGNLKITRTLEAIEERDRFLQLPSDIALCELLEDFLGNGWSVVPPEDIGALTDAPILSNDISYADDGTVDHVGKIWFHADYQVENAVELILNGGVEFTLLE